MTSRNTVKVSHIYKDRSIELIYWFLYDLRSPHKIIRDINKLCDKYIEAATRSVI